jgi:hypothetical protein
MPQNPDHQSHLSPGHLISWTCSGPDLMALSPARGGMARRGRVGRTTSRFPSLHLVPRSPVHQWSPSRGPVMSWTCSGSVLTVPSSARIGTQHRAKAGATTDHLPSLTPVQYSRDGVAKRRRLSAMCGCSNVCPYQLLTSLVPGLWLLADLGKPREEPSAGKPLARICESDAEWLNYSTTT